jgi:hypothetical protein
LDKLADLMPKFTNFATNFTAGEISPRLASRIDTQKYRNGAAIIENFITTAHGGARKRGGTKFVAPIKAGQTDVRLIPFQFNVEQAYVIEFGNLYFRVFKDGGIITNTSTTITGATQANPCVITAAAHGLSNGNSVVISGVGGMTELNNRHFTVANVTTDTFELSGVNSSTYTAFTSGGTVKRILEVTTTYATADLNDLQVAQSADTLYVAHKDYLLRKVQRTSDTAWTITDVDFRKGPFRDINTVDANIITVAAYTPTSGVNSYGTYGPNDTLTLTAVNDTWTADNVGCFWRLWEPGKTTGVTQPTGGGSIANGQNYTTDKKVYGIANLNGTAAWNSAWRIPNHDSGTVRVTNADDTNYFDAVYLHDSSCVLEITAYVDAKTVRATVIDGHVPKSVVATGTSYWEEGSWSARRGYPRAITFFEQRLWLGGSIDDPATIWGSRTGAFENFQDGPDDDDSVLYAVASEQVDVIRWMKGGKVLMVGTTSSEYIVAASNQNEGLSPTNVTVKRQTAYGAAAVNPVQISNVVVFAQRSGDPDNPARKLREFVYSYEVDSFQAVDLTVISEHVTGSGIVELAFQMEPDQIVWAARADGQLIGMTYEKDQQVVGWHRHPVGGTAAEVERLCCIPGVNHDDLYMVVKRTVNGATVRYIEVLQYGLLDTQNKADGFFVDSGLTYDGSSTSSISGLWHLNGESLDILADGAVLPNATVSNGRITLTRAATKVQLGLPYTSKLLSLDIEGGSAAGASQTKPRVVTEATLRLHRSLGGRIGVNKADSDGNEVRETRTETLRFRSSLTPMDASPPLFTGDKRLELPGGWDRQARFYIEHDEPLPFHVLGLACEIQVNG